MATKTTPLKRTYHINIYIFFFLLKSNGGGYLDQTSLIPPKAHPCRKLPTSTRLPDLSFRMLQARKLLSTLAQHATLRPPSRISHLVKKYPRAPRHLVLPQDVAFHERRLAHDDQGLRLTASVEASRQRRLDGAGQGLRATAPPKGLQRPGNCAGQRAPAAGAGAGQDLHPVHADPGSTSGGFAAGACGQAAINGLRAERLNRHRCVVHRAALQRGVLPSPQQQRRRKPGE